MRGLEWSTGSSTQWVLMRVKSLISIEHHAQWSSVVAAHMMRVFGADDVAKRWKLYAVDAAPGTQEKGPDKEDITKFRCIAGRAAPIDCCCALSLVACIHHTKVAT